MDGGVFLFLIIDRPCAAVALDVLRFPVRFGVLGDALKTLGDSRMVLNKIAPAVQHEQQVKRGEKRDERVKQVCRISARNHSDSDNRK